MIFVMIRIKLLSTSLACIALSCVAVETNRCGREESIYGKMLEGSVFMKMASKTPYLCQQACDREMRCQSFNYVVYKEVCELNSRTKESRPEDFVADEGRLYMKRYKNRGE